MYQLFGVLVPCDEPFDPFLDQQWPVASLLAEYLSNHSELVASKSVIELGSGRGLCGLVAEKLGARSVMLTADGAEDVLRGLRSTVTVNESKAAVCRLLWQDDPPMDDRFDVVIGSDILYDATIRQMRALLSSPRGYCVVGYEDRRPPLSEITEEFNRHGCV
jgi:predicted nicotinamide N-methyase